MQQTPTPVLAEATPAERRRHPRLSVVRPAKVFLKQSLRYAGAETTDLSSGGALIRVDRARALRPGDEIDVAVSAPGTGAVIASDAMTPARVVRVLPIDYFHQAVAVEFKHPVGLAQVA